MRRNWEKELKDVCRACDLEDGKHHELCPLVLTAEDLENVGQRLEASPSKPLEALREKLARRRYYELWD